MSKPSDSWQPQPGKAKSAAYNIKSIKSRKLIPVSTNPHYAPVKRGLALGYRKNAKDGTWSFRRFANGRYEYHVPDAVADDEGEANGESVLSYQQAVAAAIKWDEQQQRVDTGEVFSNTHTVKDAIDQYMTDKEREKRKSLYRDRVTAKAHIIPELGNIQLKKLTHTRLKAWRDGLASAKAPQADGEGQGTGFPGHGGAF